MQPLQGSGVRSETRAGHVALVGPPNVGKSSLLNALVGEKLSIVTPRAQTTREAVTGILTLPGAQAIFVDTPGLLEPKYALQSAMLESALSALEGADLVLLMLDATRPAERPTGQALQALVTAGAQVKVAINKVDAGETKAISELTAWSRQALGVEPCRISATNGEGLAELRDSLVASLPENPFFYPEDDLATQPVRFFVAELVRETIFEEYAQEVPYSTVVRIEEFREAADPLYIRATVYVERDSQKGIVLGQGGSAIKRLGERSREKIEAFVGQRVYLDLWVKALPGWRRKRSSLRYLGYRVPADEGREGGPRGRPA